ncbi:MAG: hypothetical protein WD360_08190 [Nitriliruptoraceae bacterium]
MSIVRLPHISACKVASHVMPTKYLQRWPYVWFMAFVDIDNLVLTVETTIGRQQPPLRVFSPHVANGALACPAGITLDVSNLQRPRCFTNGLLCGAAGQIHERFVTHRIETAKLVMHTMAVV